jgi:hypothetical protein
MAAGARAWLVADEIPGLRGAGPQWLIRITFSLWYWPVKDKQTEHELVKRFAGPSVTQGLREREPASDSPGQSR